MYMRLPFGSQPPSRKICIQISQQQRALEENQARRPHRGRTTKSRQNQLGKKRLDQKKEKGGKKNCRREEQRVQKGAGETCRSGSFLRTRIALSVEGGVRWCALRVN